jgi:hypothetical protein
VVDPNNQEPKRVADRQRRRKEMRRSRLLEDFCSYLSVERGCSPRTVVTYRKYFSYFLTFATAEVPGNTDLREHFTPELCCRYQ